jgi:nucleotide-binding universal stress UspA family protein
MMKNTAKHPIKRILVAMDASEHSVAAMEEAAKLAAGLEAELLGLFVEDINLLRLAALPFARELADLSASERQLSSSSMEKSLRAQAERMRRQLQLTAERTRVQWSFHVARGNVLAELLAHTPDFDLLILGRVGRSLRRAPRLGSIAQGAISRSSCTVMLVQHGRAIEHPVLVIYDGRPTGQQALALAATLARQDKEDLVVLLPPGDAKTVASLRRQAEKWLSSHETGARILQLDTADAGELASTVEAEDGRVLILDASHELANDQTFFDLVQCPVVLVR